MKDGNPERTVQIPSLSPISKTVPFIFHPTFFCRRLPMPITMPFSTRRVSQSEFGEISYGVMEQVFAIHNEFGRFFDERIYKRELEGRVPDLKLEVPVTVRHKTFCKLYYLDVLVSASALFELKAVDAIHPRHRAQMVNYLLLTDLAHGKIVNTRPEQVQHEFVNCLHRLADLRNPAIQYVAWNENIDGAAKFSEQLRLLANDWGVGLEVALYEEALSQFLCGMAELPVYRHSSTIGTHKMRMAAPAVAFRITALTERLDLFEIHTRRQLKLLALDAILWANMTTDEIRFTSIERQ